ncbi:hypothetical protein A2U01_0019226 [Trifolium medium]|uniref:Uncharacterized protein n=1 Tax=Trifolium medium TaxID=97028 RepID=A0A392NEC8_9FABA|nr:hypothetical protein [Trifolium medium]
MVNKGFKRDLGFFWGFGGGSGGRHGGTAAGFLPAQWSAAGVLVVHDEHMNVFLRGRKRRERE